MGKRRELNVFNLALLDIITGALGAVIILYVAVPKGMNKGEELENPKVSLNEEQIQDLMAEVKRLQSVRDAAQSAILENEELKEKVSAAEKKIEEIEKKEEVAEAEKKSSDGQTLDIGFKFKGKRIVFAIDTSRSMYDEDRMGQVKAGLKMLILSMPAGFEIEIVQFPNGRRSAYKPMFSSLKPLQAESKYDALDFVYAMKPNGATPIRDTFNFIFKNYKNVSDIVLLTDGEPSLHESPLKDDIYDLLSHITKLNKNTKIQINAIGVGQEVLKDKTANAYQFLKLLAEQHSGFFIGF
jgi:hypothetical protein